MVWFITIQLQALLLDELWISTCLAKTVGLCQSASFHPTFQYVNLQLSGSCTGCFHLTGNKKIQQTSNAGGGLGVARGQLREIALLQHRQPPPTGPPSPDSTDPNISAFSNLTFISSTRWSQSLSTVRTLDRRTSWAPHRRTAQRPLLHPSRSLRYPPHDPFGSGWHYLQQSHARAF